MLVQSQMLLFNPFVCVELFYFEHTVSANIHPHYTFCMYIANIFDSFVDWLTFPQTPECVFLKPNSVAALCAVCYSWEEMLVTEVS